MSSESTASFFGRIGAAYERIQVPAIFGPWARDLVATAVLRPGERVLDVACGTGIVARTAAPLVGAGGQVVGLDVNESMLGVARAQPAPEGAAIEWRQGDATSLPFADGAFDAVLCQQGIQFMPDRRAALGEMRRVLTPGGRAALSIWQRRDEQAIWEELVARYVGADALSGFREQYRRLESPELEAELRAAGFRRVDLALRHRTARFSSLDVFLEYQLSGRMANALSALSEAERTALLADAVAAFEAYRDGEGLAMPQSAYVALAQP